MPSFCHMKKLVVKKGLLLKGLINITVSWPWFLHACMRVCVRMCVRVCACVCAYVCVLCCAAV